MEEVTIGPWPVHRLGPSGIFEQIRLDAMGLVHMLDSKLDELSERSTRSARSFAGWLASLRSFADAVIFHGGEVVDEGARPLTAIVVIGSADESRIAAGIRPRGCPGLVEAGLLGIEDFMALETPNIDPSALRPFLASELLVLGARRDIEMMEAMFQKLRAAFESSFIEDLLVLVGMDVKNDIFGNQSTAGKVCKNGPILLEETDYSGKKPVKKLVIETNEFERIALRAMRRRRVPAGLQSFLLPQLKATVGRAGGS